MEQQQPHKRRVRYQGTHPHRFSEKYKELNAEQYPEEIEKVKQRGQTPAGMHCPICVEEILDFLDPQTGETGMDATLGYGGHAQRLLERIAPGGKLFATDVDSEEQPKTVRRLLSLGDYQNILIPRLMNFAGIGKLLPEFGDGLDFFLADLGISSMQLDNPDRGFSFKRPGPLDLRLNPANGIPARIFIKKISPEKLTKLRWINADEPRAEELAHAICANAKNIDTTTELAAVINQIAPEDSKTRQRVFQALRIAVNDEFSALDQLLRTLPLAMKHGGRIAILTFHSGEDRRVLHSFLEQQDAGIYRDVNIEPIRPGREERYNNPRSKCARLRVAVKV